MLPVLQIYKKGGMPGVYNSYDNTKWAKWSLGNLGYSTVQCSIAPLGLDKMALQCPYGNIQKIV